MQIRNLFSLWRMEPFIRAFRIKACLKKMDGVFWVTLWI